MNGLNNLDNEEDENIFKFEEENETPEFDKDEFETPEIDFEDEQKPNDDDDDEQKPDDNEPLDLFKEKEDEGNDDELNLSAINKTLGSDFKTVEEFKKSLQSIDKKEEEDTDSVELTKATNNVNTFTDFINFDDTRLVRQNLMAEAQAAGKNIGDEDVKKEIELKIETLKDTDTLTSYANTVRNGLKTFVQDNQKKIDEIHNKRSQTEEQKKIENTKQLQEAFTNIFSQKNFFGVDVNQEIVNKAYKSVKDGSFFKKVNADQGMIARLAMFAELEAEISKKAGGPTHSDGIKKVLDTLGVDDKQKQSIADRVPASREAARDLIDRFVK